MSGKRFLFAANWKMNKNPRETERFVEEFFTLIDRKMQRNIVLLPSTICMAVVRRALSGSNAKWGSQDCYFEESGAFTGETSPKTLAEYGAEYCLAGHSERRKLCGETDEIVAKKVAAIQKFFMTPILCIGESLEEREAGKTNEVLAGQLKSNLAYFDHGKNIVIAYEPVWAIGTGKTAEPDQVAESHRVIRNYLKEIGGETLAEHTHILYGGSVKPENAVALRGVNDVDGFLIGGASLDPKTFSKIIKSTL